MGRSHRFPAAHDPEILKTAVSLKTKVEGGRLRIAVKNDGTGHNAPADERHRAIDLVVTLRDRVGNAVSARVDRFRNPYRDEFNLKNPLRKPGDEYSYEVDFGELGKATVVARRVAAAFNPIRKVYYPESTQIPAGEARTYEITLPPNASGASMRLIYKLTPFVEDDRGTLLHEASHEIQ
jgi:hypothetical protein